MKRTRTAAAVLLLLAAGGSAAAQEFVISATGGWFQPRDKDFREIYGGGPVFGLQAYLTVTGGLGIWAGVDYYSKSGEITFTGERTEIRLIPIYAGLRYQIGSGAFRPYIAGGPAYVRFREETPLGSVEDGAFGVIGQAGLVVQVLRFLHLDFHGRFSAASAKPVELEEEIGGLTGAVGLAFVF